MTGVDYPHALERREVGHRRHREVPARGIVGAARAGGRRPCALAFELQRRAEELGRGEGAPGRSDWPSAIVIPAQPRATPRSMLRCAFFSAVRSRSIVRAASFNASGKNFPAGSYVITTAQPYGGFAKTLLENAALSGSSRVSRRTAQAAVRCRRAHASASLGFDVAMIKDPVTVASTRLAPVAATPWVAEGLTGNSSRRIAIFTNAAPSMDEGWTRWVFDQYRIPFTKITARDIRAGNLDSRFDAIIIPEQNARQIANGPGAGIPIHSREDSARLARRRSAKFVDGGGTLIAFNDASGYAIEALSLPVKDELDGVRPTDFYAPGSILRIELDRSNPLTAGYTAPS